MKEQLIAFLTSPSRDTYKAVRDIVVSSDRYEPYSDEMNRADKLIKDGGLQDARALISGAMPNLLLSPRAHLMLAHVLKALGDERGGHVEGTLAVACVKGILATGDGTQPNPYLVLRTSDEYDIMQLHLRRELVRQSLVKDDPRVLDVLHCRDGSDVWFDITDAYRKLNASLAKRNPQ